MDTRRPIATHSDYRLASNRSPVVTAPVAVTAVGAEATLLAFFFATVGVVASSSPQHAALVARRSRCFPVSANYWMRSLDRLQMTLITALPVVPNTPTDMNTDDFRRTLTNPQRRSLTVEASGRNRG